MAADVGNPFKISKYGFDFPPRAGLLSTWGYIDFIPVDEIHIPDHVKRTQGLLIEQFEKRPKINGFVAAFAQQWQVIEDVGVEIYTLRMIHTAGGYTLDMIGEIVGVVRGGLNDDDYRAQIIFGIFLNISNGEPEVLISALLNVTGATTLHYTELYPATVYLSIHAATIPANTLEKIQKLAPAGVKVIVDYVNTDIRPFVFAGEGTLPTPPEGGHFAELGYGGADPGYKPGAFSELLT